MGKKKHQGFKPSSKPQLKSAVGSDDDDDEGIEQHLQSLLEDEIDSYNKKKEDELLGKANKGKKGGLKGRGGRRGVRGDDDDEEEEIYGLGMTSSEDEDEDDIEEVDDDDEDKGPLGSDLEDSDNDSDIMGIEDPSSSSIPDPRAWGKKSRLYHGADYVDQDFGGFEGDDAEMAMQEEEEAKEIQKRLTEELDEADFLLMGIPSGGGVDKKKKGAEGLSSSLLGGGVGGREILKVDFDRMSITEKRKVVERECPEVIHMLEEYKERLKEARKVRKVMDDGGVRDEILQRFYQSKLHTLLNYCINISYYLYLRSTSPKDCKGHPVIKRILQFRRLLDELQGFDPDKYVPQEGDRQDKSKKKKKVKKVTFNNEDQGSGNLVDFKFGNEDEEEEDIDEDEGGKRGITYAIAKNKGLTPRRKKEQRNPRVKHREKYRKAKIRRKGQVRTPRTETRRYDGEMTGIKANLVKSVKLK